MSDQLKGIKKVDRDGLKDAYQKNYADWIIDAKDRNIDFSSYLNEVSPLPKEADQRDPENAVHSLLRSHGFAMKDTTYRKSSLVADLENNPVLETLVRTDLDNYYKSILFTPELLTRAKVGGIAPGESFRPFTELPVRDQQQAGNRVRLSDLLAITQTINGQDIRLPKFVPPPDHEMSMDYMVEFQDYPIFDIKQGSEKHTMKVVGVGLRWSYRFARASQMRAELLRRAVARVAILHEASLIQEGLVTVMKTIASDDAADDTAHAVQRYPASGEANYTQDTQNAVAYALPQAYNVDTIVGGSAAVTAWENINTGSTNLTLAALQAQAPGNVRRFTRRNINVAYPENTLVITKDITENPNGEATAADSTDLDVSGYQLLFFDSNETLGLAMEAGSNINETVRKEDNQSFVQYLSNSYTFYILDPNGRIKVHLNAPS